ncbi:MAG TPA: hypothetical protein VJS85_05910 [Rhizomicrobium sp.]|nr:hypothetical protein [Rhizomicrobium sp.]
MAMKLAARLLGLCLCLGTALVPTRAQDSPPPATPAPLRDSALAEFDEANAAIVATLVQEGGLPSLDNPVYGRAVSRAFDVSVLEKDLNLLDLSGTCNRANATQAVYIIYGARKEDMDPFAIQPRLKREPNARIAKLKSDNYLRFQNEQVAALGFLLACRTLELERLNNYLAQMPHDEMVVFRLCFADFQDSLAETVTYHVESLRDPVRPENRQAVLDLLAQDIDKLAAGMTKQSRRTVAATLAKVMVDPQLKPDERATLKKVSLALKRKDCGAVCAFH